MNIAWYGQTCFRIISQKAKNGSVNILIDPFNKGTGLRSPKLESDILLITHDNQSKKEIPSCNVLGSNGDSSKNSFLITSPGEYDVREVYINGFSASAENTIYTIETEEMRICHLGLLGQGDLTSDQLEKINEVDILMIPIGGGEAIDAKGAIKIMSQIEPKITIPMYYKIPKLKTRLEGLDKFLKALGIKSLPSLDKLSIKKKDISNEEVKIVALKP